MPRLPRTPFFETAVKNYLWGDAVLDYARAAEEASRRHDVDVLFFPPTLDVRRVAEACPGLIVMAPYMDALRPGRGIADVLPEGLAAAGAKGVLVNHSERPMSLAQIRLTIERAREVGLLTFACADTVAEARAIAALGPDILNPEPTELIGSGSSSPLSYVREVADAIRGVDPRILVEQAAGIKTASEVYEMVLAGSDGAGASSGILTADDPHRVLDEMIAAVASARDQLSRARAVRAGEGG